MTHCFHFLASQSLLKPVQSEFHPLHCNGMALFKVISSKAVNQFSALLLLLDLSVAFGMCHHPSLWSTFFPGVPGQHISWVVPDLIGCELTLSDGSSRPLLSLCWGAQGSVLDFLIYLHCPTAISSSPIDWRPLYMLTILFIYPALTFLWAPESNVHLVT